MQVLHRLICVGLLIYGAAAAVGYGQELDSDCRPIILPAQCRLIQSQIDAAEAAYNGEIEALQEELRTASPGRKNFIFAQIRRLRTERANDRQLRQLRIDLANCRRQFDTAPRRTVAANVLNASFAGTVVTRTTHSRAGGPFSNALNLGLQFSRNRCDVTITSFPSISFPAPTPIGAIAVTISKIGGGNGKFFPITGQIAMPLRLRFHYDTILAGADTADTPLTTASSISARGTFSVTGMRFTSTNNAPIDQCGRTIGGSLVTCTVTLVGTTVFQDGFLGGNEGSFVATGTISAAQQVSPGTRTRQECLDECEAFFQDCMGDRGRGGTRPAQCARLRTNCRNRCPAR